MVVCGIAVELQPREPIFEKCPHLREKGGVLTLRTPVGFALTPTVPLKEVTAHDRHRPKLDY